MMGIDGTWQRDYHGGRVGDRCAADYGGNARNLNLKFFLLLSSTGLAYRRCGLAWVNGDQVERHALKLGDNEKGRRSNAAPAEGRKPAADSSACHDAEAGGTEVRTPQACV